MPARMQPSSHPQAPISWIKLACVVVVALLAMPGVLQLSRTAITRSSAAAVARTGGGRSLHKASPSPTPAASSPKSASSSAPAPQAAPRASRNSSTATRAFSGGPSMSTQKLRYRDPIVFNARENHTGGWCAGTGREAKHKTGCLPAGSASLPNPPQSTAPTQCHTTPMHTHMVAGTIIMLHGLGDSGDGWAPVGAEWAPDLKHVKFVFPHAPNVRQAALSGLTCSSS